MLNSISKSGTKEAWGTYSIKNMTAGANDICYVMSWLHIFIFRRVKLIVFVQQVFLE